MHLGLFYLSSFQQLFSCLEVIIKLFLPEDKPGSIIPLSLFKILLPVSPFSNKFCLGLADTLIHGADIGFMYYSSLRCRINTLRGASNAVTQSLKRQEKEGWEQVEARSSSASA